MQNVYVEWHKIIVQPAFLLLQLQYSMCKWIANGNIFVYVIFGSLLQNQ